MKATPDWSGTTGDIWAIRWRDTDRGLAEVGAKLDEAIAARAPEGPFRALDIGCGPGTTSLALAQRRPDAQILGCDLSQALVAIARERSNGLSGLVFVAEDAEAAAPQHGPFDLLYSRHGVMFFEDPLRAFRALREAAAPGASIVFSCFQSWSLNPWASELATAAAGKPVPAPGREPSGFAFAETDYVREILTAARWHGAEVEDVRFSYVPGQGPDAEAEALAFLAELGPASRVLDAMPESDRPAALKRMREVIRAHLDDERVAFPAAAWIWSARAA